MWRTITISVLLVLATACNRPPSVDNVSGSVTGRQKGADTETPSVAASPSASGDAAAAEESDNVAGRESAPVAVVGEERAQGCAGEIGLPGARRLVEQCTDVSPSTRSPCNAANSCNLIREEIARGCSFLEEDAPEFCEENR
jgi:hypothetical protein